MRALFTGIIEDRGTVVDYAQSTDSATVTIRSSIATRDAKPGDSIAVAGVCLTVVELGDHTFTADIMGETLHRTTLGSLRRDDRVNLERALAVGERLGGHIVQGHVDAVGTVLAVRHDDNWRVVRIGLPAEIARFVVAKGSIAVDGISLTVSAVAPDDNWFEISLIPETIERTTLGSAVTGTPVNLETDILARHVDKLLNSPTKNATAHS